MELESLAELAGKILIYSLLTGIVLGILSWIFVRSRRTLTASTSYLMLYLTLIAILMVPILQGLPELPSPRLTLPTFEGQSASAALEIATLPGAEEKNQVEPFAQPVEAINFQGQPVVQIKDASETIAIRDDVSVEQQTVLLEGFSTSAIEVAPLWFIVISGLWLLGFMVLVFRLIRGYVLLNSCRTRSLPASLDERNLLKELSNRIGVKRKVELRYAKDLNVPMAAGFLRPVIFLPEKIANQVNKEEMEHVILHELAHLARRDDWTQLGQRIIQTLLFFHPVVYWLSRRLNLERELACDDWVVSKQGGSRKPYASSLLKIASLNLKPALPAVEGSAMLFKSQIEKRITLLLDEKRRVSDRVSKIWLLTSLGALFAVGFMVMQLSPSIAQIQQAIEETIFDGLTDNTTVDSEVQRRMDLLQVPGVVVGVVKDGQFIYANGFGVETLGQDKAVTPKTIFKVAAIAKSVTATAIMQLVEQGKIDLHATVITYLPDFKMIDSTNGQLHTQVTVHQLLTHTAGLPDDFSRDDYQQSETDSGSLTRFVSSLATRDLDSSGRFTYSGVGYSILGEIVAQVSGQSYEDYVQEHIFKPLGMKNTTMLYNEVDKASFASPHITGEDANVALTAFYPYTRWNAPVDELFSNLEDVARYLTAFMNGGELDGNHILQPESIDLMWTGVAQTKAHDFDRDYGLGWVVGDLSGLFETVAHNGNGYGGRSDRDYGYSSEFVLVPDQNVALIIMTNFADPAAFFGWYPSYSLRDRLLPILFSQIVTQVETTVSNTITLNNADDIELLDVLETNSIGINELTFSPDGKKLLGAARNGTVWLWDLANLEAAPEFFDFDAASSRELREVLYSPDGTILATSDDSGRIKFWDALTFEQIGQDMVHELNRQVYSLAFSPDGKVLASGSRTGTIILWDVETQTALTEPLATHNGFICELVFSPDGSMLLSGSADGQVILTNPETRQVIGEPIVSLETWVCAATFSPDGQHLLSGNNESISIWDVATREKIDKSLIGHLTIQNPDREQPTLWELIFNPNQTLLASASGDNSVILWDAATYELVGQPLSANADHEDRQSRNGVSDVVFNPDGSLIAFSNWNGDVLLWGLPK